MDEMVDLVDSPEFRRTARDCTDSLLGGKAADVCGCSVSLLGNGGTRLADLGGVDTSFWTSVLLLWGRLGGGGFFVGRAGTVGVACCEWPLRPGDGALCACEGVRDGGRWGGGGGGALLVGAVKFLCLFKAAIRSCRLLKTGSSSAVSAMFASYPIDDRRCCQG